MRAFGQSGRKKQTGLLQRAPRSVIGVLQLAYFSMRYGSLLGLTSGEFYQKSYPAVFPGSTPKRTLVGYFRHPTRGSSAAQILRRLKSGKGLKQIAPLPVVAGRINQTRQLSGRQVWIAFLMSARESFSFSARSASFATSPSEAKRRPTSCSSVSSGMRERKGSGNKIARRSRSSSRITRSCTLRE